MKGSEIKHSMYYRTYYRSREVPRNNISLIYLHAAVESKTQIRNYIKIVIFLLCIPKINRQCKYVLEGD